ncbi:hypothetical protein L596_024377 [Steinernema carpocapsae]|uniref:Uncharacterized protein n=1 Tax=Steinernema carpocapsae TaxID=34508 RepID=A0A4U5MGK0_STECR|nr:hypothetical protein L596_024377 [Steinernema carpocapsae]
MQLALPIWQYLFRWLISGQAEEQPDTGMSAAVLQAFSYYTRERRFRVSERKYLRMQAEFVPRNVIKTQNCLERSRGVEAEEVGFPRRSGRRDSKEGHKSEFPKLSE